MKEYTEIKTIYVKLERQPDDDYDHLKSSFNIDDFPNYEIIDAQFSFNSTSECRSMMVLIGKKG